MRGMYWKPEGASQVQRGIVAAIAIVGLVAVEVFPSEEQQPYYAEKMLAARKAAEAFEVIHQASDRRGIPLRTKTDPTGSRLIGQVLSPITSGSGSLVSKQTTVNPNFAAVVVEWLKDLNLKNGDIVAVGVSGSFPAVNIAVYSALHELDLEPVIISSAAASQWGANDPSLTWLDMEAVLRKSGVFPYKSVAASLGGVGDDAIGLSTKGRRMLEKAIERNDIPFLATMEEEQTAIEDVEQAGANLTLVDEARVRERLRVYYEAAADRPIKAYINVGGGTVSVGTKVGKHKFSPGLNLRPPRGIEEIPPSVIGAFLEAGVPGIHLTSLVTIAAEYGLEIAPRSIPELGSGGVFQKREPNRWLAGIVLAILVIALFIIARAPWGTRMLRTTIPPESVIPPSPPSPSGFAPHIETPRVETGEARVEASDGNGSATDPPRH